MIGDTHTFRVLFKDQDRLKRLEEEVPAPWSPPAWSRPFEVKIKDDDDAAMFRIRFAAEIEAAAVHDANVLSMTTASLAARVVATTCTTMGISYANAVWAAATPVWAVAQATSAASTLNNGSDDHK